MVMGTVTDGDGDGDGNGDDNDADDADNDGLSTLHLEVSFYIVTVFRHCRKL